MAQGDILQIPLPGGSGHAPTGAVQFKDDWPGLFIRGDDAIALMWSIRQLTKHLADHPDPEVFSALHRLSRYADIIDQDVRMRAE